MGKVDQESWSEIIEPGTKRMENPGKKIRPTDLDPDLCRKIRASILLAGPLVRKNRRITLPPPGGDVIGRRRVDTHMLALEKLGAKVTYDRAFRIQSQGLKAQIYSSMKPA